MQRAHRRDEGDALAARAPRARPRAHLARVGDDLHRTGASRERARVASRRALPMDPHSTTDARRSSRAASSATPRPRDARATRGSRARRARGRARRRRDEDAGEMDFNELERREGVRLSWNAWPCSRIEATRVVLPIGALVTPGRDLGDAAPTLPYEPVVCEGCQAALNPYCAVDYYGKTWRCSLCDGLNKLPRNYEQISENNLPAELFPTYTSVEYTMTNKTPTAPRFVLCVDCACGSAEELQDAKDSVMQLVSLLPEDAFVALVTFGSTVRVHELAETNGAMRRSYVFRGTKDCEQEDLRKMLGLDFNRQRAGMNGMNGMNGAAAMMPNGVDAKPVRRFVAPISECEFTLQSVLDEVTLDEEKTERGKRALTGDGRGYQHCRWTFSRIARVTRGSCAHVHLRAVHRRAWRRRGDGYEREFALAPRLGKERG